VVQKSDILPEASEGRIVIAEHPGLDRIGVGLYSIPEAARLLKTPAQRIQRWIQPDDVLIPRAFDLDERILSFFELIELHFVKLFRDAGVSLQTIRRAAKVAARTFGTRHPFAVHRFDTDGCTIFATLGSAEQGKSLLEDLEHGQYAFDQILRPFFKKLEYGKDDVVRYWPLDTTGRIVLDPKRRFGKPIDCLTGVPTNTLFHAVETGETEDAVAAWFNVPAEAVRAAVAFEKSLAS
jgi:uncharacterized protein (DUF433 family)